MDIITSHNALDFDGLASMVAAGKLYPGAIKVFSGTLNNNVKRFLALYKDSLVIRAPREIPLERVTRMIVVDTANISRLGNLQTICRENDIEYYVYDHHPPNNDDFQGVIHEVHRLGACTTILVEHIIERGVSLTPFEATILALGIYDDTGSLLFDSTTARDLKVAAYLREQGANLQIVANFMEKFFSTQQTRVLQELMDCTQRLRVKNIEACIAVHEGEEFIAGLDLVTFRLFGMEDCDVIFVIALMEGKVNAVGRSRVAEVRINEVLNPLGGRGHEKVGSAVVRGKTCQEVKAVIMESLEQHIHPPLTAREIMSTPVKSIPPSHTMEEAGRLMLRYGHTGMPVVEDGRLIGVISRRDVDKANFHDLGHAPVKGFMTSSVKSVSPGTQVREVQKMMVEMDVGRLPVIEDDRLIGIISRTDILRTLHGDDAPEDHQILYAESYGEEENYSL
ncbi:MAG: CBS domain-containing protein, partial [Syntrophomonadaceae bacterium]|nr:CBS domain-containing protein [Syntrophomonadaceae bacterium]